VKKLLLWLAAALLLTTISATPLMADGNPYCGPSGCGGITQFSVPMR